MATSLTDFRSTVLDALLDLLWRQWTSLGLAGQSQEVEDRIIDPEPLLLLSLTVCRYDARLFDEILDWLTANGSFLNVQRLKAIRSQLGFQCQAQLGAVASLLGNNTAQALKWKTLAEARDRTEPEPLFFLRDGRPLPLPPGHAPEFSAHGLLRTPVKLRGYSQSFPTQGTATLLLRLRALLGVNARCEILCLLGAAEEIHPSLAARQSGYLPRTVQNALAEMARSGVVQVRSANREKHYRLQPGVLDRLLKPDGRPTHWTNWSSLFRALEMLWLGVTAPKRQDLDRLLLASELRRLSKDMRPLLGEAGYGQALRDDQGYRGESYAEVFFEDVQQLLKRLNFQLEDQDAMPAQT